MRFTLSDLQPWDPVFPFGARQNMFLSSPHDVSLKKFRCHETVSISVVGLLLKYLKFPQLLLI
jgi:hypothetical protein